MSSPLLSQMSTKAWPLFCLFFSLCGPTVFRYDLSPTRLCSIPPLWRCLCHLFHLLQEFLQLYRTVLALRHLKFPMLTWHLHQQNTYRFCFYLKRNDLVIMHSLRNNTSNIHHYLLSLFQPFHPRNNTLYYHHIYFALSLPPHFPDT